MSTIFLTNWSSKLPGVRGPGKRFNIMAQPREWEHGDGNVRSLTPDHKMLLAVKAGHVSVRAYRDDFIRGARAYPPGVLKAGAVTVEDGDTLLCSCSREKAAAGECHRVWSAELLRRSGWRVVLDGQELAGVDGEWRPVFAETGLLAGLMGERGRAKP